MAFVKQHSLIARRKSRVKNAAKTGKSQVNPAATPGLLFACEVILQAQGYRQ